MIIDAAKGLVESADISDEISYNASLPKKTDV